MIEDYEDSFQIPLDGAAICTKQNELPTRTLGEYFFIPCLIANPPSPTSKSGDLE
jgi:hypothetical protein